tara:strand:- start:2020 stop:2304 length:285 start_codon:yes stop_codon:yes gene_type:complete
MIKSYLLSIKSLLPNIDNNNIINFILLIFIEFILMMYIFESNTDKELMFLTFFILSFVLFYKKNNEKNIFKIIFENSKNVIWSLIYISFFIRYI